MQNLPTVARPYSRTSEFVETSVPAGLLKAHTTKDGTWALIHVLEGRLAYRIVDPRRPHNEIVLTPASSPGVVKPTILHEIEPLGSARFYVEFHRVDGCCRQVRGASPDSRPVAAFLEKSQRLKLTTARSHHVVAHRSPQGSIGHLRLGDR